MLAPMLLAERMDCLVALGCVDAVVAFDENTSEVLLRRLAPHISAVAKGPDYAGRAVPSAGLEVMIARPGRFARHTSDPVV